MRLIYLLPVMLLSAQSFAQSTVGQVAHWNMNGSGNDISGNGHTGHLFNVTPALGKDGVAGHGYYFNGVDSKITVPYAPGFNLTKYSICATIKVQGFYAGPCHANVIFFRGKSSSGTGNYNLYFTDLPSNAGCTLFDSSLEVFSTGTGEHPMTSIALTDYTPHVVKDVWYSVVGTFNDTVYKIYVNGVLKSTVPTTAPHPLSASTDSVSLGFNVYEPGYPYPFKGIMDDVRLFNRVLDTSEITTYTTSTTLGIENSELQPEVSLFPNPVKDALTLDFRMDIAKNTSMKIFDLTGRQLMHQELNKTTNVIDVVQLQPGMYFISISCDGEITNSKFLKE